MSESVGLRLKDWITLFLSTVAFFIAAGTAYFNIIRQQDNLSLVLRGGPLPARIDNDNLAFSTETSFQLIFFNVGTRAAIITSVNIFFVQERANKPQTCDGTYEYVMNPPGPFEFLETDLEPMVIR